MSQRLQKFGFFAFGFLLAVGLALCGSPGHRLDVGPLLPLCMIGLVIAFWVLLFLEL